MTDRIDAFVVVLESDIRDDAIESTVNALRVVRGVIAVEPHVADDLLQVMVVEQRFISRMLDELREFVDRMRAS